MGEANMSRKLNKKANRKGKIGQPHAQQSYASLVSKATRDLLKPFINQQIQEFGNSTFKMFFQKIEPFLTKVGAFESLLISRLGITATDIEVAVAEMEDKATGYVISTEPAKAGDLIRVTYTVKEKDSEEWGSNEKMLIKHLDVEPRLFFEEVEAGMIGMKIGETKEIIVTEHADLTAKITIDRISLIPEVEKEEKT